MTAAPPRSRDFRAARIAAGLETREMAAAALESDLSAVRRWDNGQRTVPGPVWVALRCIARLRDMGVQPD